MLRRTASVAALSTGLSGDFRSSCIAHCGNGAALRQISSSGSVEQVNEQVKTRGSLVLTLCFHGFLFNVLYLVLFECWLWPYVVCILEILTGQWLLRVFGVGVGVALKSPVCVVLSSKWRNQQYRELLLPSVCFHFMFLQHTWGESGSPVCDHGCFSSKFALFKELKNVSRSHVEFQCSS